MNNNNSQSNARWIERLPVNRRQFCTALGMMGVALATPGLVAGHPLGMDTDTAGSRPRGRRKTFNKTVGIL